MSTRFATRISGLRKERGLSQKKVAADLGISSALLSHYENGIRECGLDFVRKISGYYRVSSDYLLGLTEERGQGSEGGTTLETLHYAARFLDEQLGDEMSDRFETLYLLTVYRALSSCAPEEQASLFRYSPEVTNMLTEALTAHLRQLPVQQCPAVEPEEIPPCVLEIIEKAENAIGRMTKELLDEVNSPPPASRL